MSVPLVPVIVAEKLPDAEPVQSRVDVPDPPATLAGETLHKRSIELVPTVRETAPLKPFREAAVIVDDPFVPVVTKILVGLEVNEKS